MLVRKCDSCQRFASKLKFSSNTPLKPVEVEAPFQQWGMDFIGEISPKSSASYSWILVATDYFTKWLEAIPTRNATSKVVNSFLLSNVIYYLQHMEAPSHLTENEKRSTKLQAIRYILVQGSLWWRNFKGILLKCVDQEKAKEVLSEMHARVCG